MHSEYPPQRNTMNRISTRISFLLAIVFCLAAQGVWAQTAQNLPYSLPSGKGNAELTAPNGWTKSDIGTDYSDNLTKLKFDKGGSTATILFNSTPDSLYFYIKGNSISGSYKFEVQESANGSSWSNIASFTSGIPASSTEYGYKLASGTRYIKWVYTTKATGNVGIGTIRITKAAGPSLPTVSTTTASNIGYNSFDAGGNVTADGGATVTQKGLTWDVVSPATASGSINGSGTGSFTSTADSVNPNTKYFYRAYATNTAGTAYGNEYSVITLPEAPVQGTPDNATTDGFTAKWLAPSVPGTQTYTYTLEVDDDNTFVSVDYSKSGIVSSATSEVISGLLSNTTYYYRVKAVNATGSGAWSATASITTEAITTPYLQITAAMSDFGSVCINTSHLDSFEVSGGNLNGASVNIGALPGMTYSLNRTSGFASTLSLPAYNGTPTTIYVKFVPTAVQSYNGNISISGGGATSINTAVTGSGINSAPSVTTNAATAISSDEATISGTVTDEGCSTITTVGLEYSTTPGFSNGSGTTVTSSRMGAGFSATLSALNPKTTYYYKAFAENGAGKVYGTQLSFTTAALQTPVATAASGIQHDEFTANWTAVAGADAYAIDVSTTPFDDENLVVGWDFVHGTNNPKANLGLPINTNAVLSNNAGTMVFSSTSSKNAMQVASGWDGGANAKFWAIGFSTKGYGNLNVSSSQRSSAKGPGQFRLEYSLDSSTWSAVTGADDINPGSSYTNAGKLNKVSLPGAMNDKTKVYLRWIMRSNVSQDGSTVTNSGNSNITEIYINGSRAVGGDVVSNANVNGLYHEVNSLNANTNYFYRVRALSPNDTSSNSSIIAVKTYNNPTTATYVSVADGDFSNPANWTYNNTDNNYIAATTPPSDGNVFINHNIAFDQNFTLATGKLITVAAGSTITINPGVTLDLNNQNMVLKSDAGATAALGQIKGSLTNASKVTIERYIPAKRAWRHLSAPISHMGAPTIFESWMESGSSSPGFGTHITGTGTGYWDSTTGPSVKAINLAGSDWAAIGGTDNPVSDYQSYMLFVRGDRTIDLSQGTAAAPNATILRITGMPATGLQNKPVFYAKPFSDIGNPYASAVDFTKLTRERIADLFYVWDPKRGTNGAWVTFTGPTYAPAEGTGGSYTNATNTIIESGQAFIVVHDGLSSVDGGVTFEEEDKVDGNTGGNVFKPASTANKITVQLNENNNGTIGLMDGASVWMDAGFDNTVNKSDVTKMINFGENIAFTREGKYLVVEKRQPAVTANDTLFVALWNTKQKNYQLSLDLNIDPTLTASLEDLYNNTSTVLNNSGNTVYDFAVTADAASQHYQRFIIVLKPGSTLPCKFVSIGASKKESKAVINFTVANELNISEYIVERSGNGKDFDAAGSVKSVNNNQQLNSYSLTDAAPFAGSNYYRVKALSKDGKFDYSAVVALGAGTPRGEMFVYPNPVANGNFNLQLTAAEKGNYEVRIFDVSGREVYGGKLTVESEYQNIQMSVPAMNTSGVYILQMVKNGTVMMQQNIISK